MGATYAQHEASVVVVECLTSDEHVWRARLESRGADSAAAVRPGHKPATWEDLQQLLDGCALPSVAGPLDICEII